MSRKPYPSDLSDTEWEKIQPLLPGANNLGSPRTVDLLEILNAIFCRVDNGCKWRALPHDFPPHQTVYDYFRRWVKTGLWQKINQTMVRQVRVLLLTESYDWIYVMELWNDWVLRLIALKPHKRLYCQRGFNALSLIQQDL
jgi:transposase